MNSMLHMHNTLSHFFTVFVWCVCITSICTVVGTQALIVPVHFDHILIFEQYGQITLHVTV